MLIFFKVRGTRLCKKKSLQEPNSFLGMRGVVGTSALVATSGLVASVLVLVGLRHLRLEVVDVLGRVRVGLGFGAGVVQVGGRGVGDGGHGGRGGGAYKVHGDVEEADDHDEAANQDVEPLPGEGQETHANIDWSERYHTETGISRDAYRGLFFFVARWQMGRAAYKNHGRGVKT